MKNVKFLILGLIFGIQSRFQAQETQINNGIGFGFQLVQYQKDFGCGLNIVSPYFAGKNMAIRLKGNLMYNENIVDSATTWMTYSNLSLGLVGVGGYVTPNIRLYGEGGMVVIFPSSKFSSEDYVFGGYGLFGFEFFFSQGGNYFIEIGGIGTGAVADRINAKPIYSNGMSLSTGFRFFLK